MNQVERGIVKGSIWLLSLRMLMRGLGVTSTLFLVRVLTPEDFGLNAIAMSIFALVDLFSRFGFDTVLIQKQNSDANDYNTAWTLNVFFGFFSFILIIIMSPYVAIFYENKNIKYILIATAFLFLINSFSNIGVVNFRKELTFQKEFILQLVPKVVSFISTIILAIYLRNYWALIIGSLIWKSSIVLLSYIMSSYRPKFSFSKIKELFSFSKWLFFNNIIQFLNTKSPELLIGKILTPSAVGLFSISTEISNMATSELVSSVNRASYPGYSIVAKDIERLKELYRGVLGSIAIWVLPAGIGLASISEIFVSCFFGHKWLGMENVLIYLALASMLFALNSNSGYIFLATAKPQVTTFISLSRVLVFIPLFIFGANHYGVDGAAKAVLCASVFVFIIYSIVLCNYLSISFADYFSVFFKPFLSSFVMALMLRIFVNYEFNMPDYLYLIVLVFCGALVYITIDIFLWSILGSKIGPEKKVVDFISKKFKKA